jgi:hypothetical protein
MASYIFIVDEEGYKNCMEHGICAVPSHKENLSIQAKALADLAGIKRDDFIFFFIKKQNKIYGVYRGRGVPFEDNTKIGSTINENYPYRILFEPTDITFENPIMLSDLYDLADKELLWSWRRVVQRDAHPFTKMETLQIIRLLYRNNPSGPVKRKISNPYEPATTQQLPIVLEGNSKGKVINKGGPESYLMASILQHLSRGGLRDIFGNYTDYVNFVPTSYNKEIDLLLLNEISIGNESVLSSVSVVELKVDKCSLKELSQTLKYESWLARKKCSGDLAMVNSIIIAHKFDDNVIDYTSKKKELEDRAPSLVQYHVNPKTNRLTLTKL